MAQGVTGSYVLPVASTTALGGVKIDGTSITIDANGVISSSGGGSGGTATDVASLTDVTLTSLQSGEILKWNGTAWVNSNDLQGSGGGTFTE